MTALGDYDLHEELGRGGMGTVHRATHRPTGAVRALKVIAGVPDAELVARFRREAEALARVGGDAVVPIHECSVDRGRLFLVMGLMPGGSLRARLEASGRFDPRAAIVLAISLARALERCHDAGLVHRDLKPDNILFDDEDRPRLADFGCVRDLAASTLTESGVSLGTPAYMAPEQLEGKRVDARGDVYALALVLHELIAGELPFPASGSPIALLSSRKSGQRTPLSSVVPATPSSLDRVLDRALAFEPGSRTASAARFASELEAVLAGKDVSPPRTGRVALVVLASSALAFAAARFVPEGTPPPPVAPRIEPAPAPPPAPARPALDVAPVLAKAIQQLEQKGHLRAVARTLEPVLAEPLPASVKDTAARLVELLLARAADDAARAADKAPSLARAELDDPLLAIRLARRLGPPTEIPPSVVRLVATAEGYRQTTGGEVDPDLVEALALGGEADGRCRDTFANLVIAVLKGGWSARSAPALRNALDRLIEVVPGSFRLRYARAVSVIGRLTECRQSVPPLPLPPRELLERAHEDLEVGLRQQAVAGDELDYAHWFRVVLEELLGDCARAASRWDDPSSPLNGKKFKDRQYEFPRSLILFKAGRNRDAAAIVRALVSIVPELQRPAYEEQALDFEAADTPEQQAAVRKKWGF